MAENDREIIFQEGNFRVVFVPKFLRTGQGERWAYDLIWEASSRTDAMGAPVWEPTNKRQSLREARNYNDWRNVKTLVDRVFWFLARKMHGQDGGGGDGSGDNSSEIDEQAKQIAAEFLGYDNETAIDEDAKKLFWKLCDAVKNGIHEAVQKERDEIIKMAENRKLDKMADAIRERSKLDVR